MRVMKILFIAGDVNRIGGIEKYNKDFLSALRKTESMVSFVCRHEGGISAKISFVLRVLGEYIKIRPNVIMCGHLNFSPICLFIKQIFGTPFTIALYGIEIISLDGRLKRQAVAEAEKVLTISKYSEELILEKFPEIKDRLVLLRSSVDGAVFSIKNKNIQLIKKLGLKDQPIILSLARLATQEDKGQDRVLRALPHVLEKFPNAVYLIVGSGQDDRVTQFLEEHPSLAASVVLAGSAQDSERVDYYNLGDVYVLPSKFEGFGIVFIESLACGVPVIASDGYGCREGLQDGELGLLVPPDDEKSIANAINDILTKNAPDRFFDRGYLRDKTLKIYGIEAWNEQVAQLVKSL